MATERKRVRVTAKGVGRVRMLVAALIGALMLNPPVLEIFSGATASRPFGWPLIVFYINIVWLLLLLLVVFPLTWRRLRQVWHSRGSARRGGGD